MAKYISFSVWGNQPLYNIGMIKNIFLAKEIYPDWQVVVYYDNTIDEALSKCMAVENVKRFDMSDSDIYGPFWRFLAANIEDCEYVIFRDADSRLSYREATAVQEWIKDDVALHVMRDHPYHKIPYGASDMAILAGMWGIKGNLFDIRHLIMEGKQHELKSYGSDQTFLVEIYERFKDSVTIHDEFFSNKPFPTKRDDYRFVGERIGINEQPYAEDWIAIKTFYENKKIHLRIKNLLIKVLSKLFK